MRWFTTGIALAAMLTLGGPGRAATSIMSGSLENTDDVVTDSIPVTLTIVPFAELDLNDFSSNLTVPNPGATGTATMTGTVNVNVPWKMAVTVTPMTVQYTEGSVQRWGSPPTYTAGPAVGVQANIANGTDDEAMWWDITATVKDSANVNTLGTSSFALGGGALALAALPAGNSNVTFQAEMTTNAEYDFTAVAEKGGPAAPLAPGLTSTVTVTIQAN